MKISKNLLAAIALTLGTSVALTSCKKNEELVVKTEQTNNESPDKNGENGPPTCGGGINPEKNVQLAVWANG